MTDLTFQDLLEISPISDLTPTIHIPLPEIRSSGNNKDLYIMNEDSQSLVSMTILFRNNNITTSPGLKKLTTKLICRGTALRTASEISEQFDFLGASYSFTSSFETFGVNLTCLSFNFEKAIEILFDSLFNSTFSDKEIQKVKKEMESELLFRDSDPDSLCGIAFSSLFYKGHYYQYPFSGFLSSISDMTRNQILHVYTSILENSKIDIFLTGPLSEERLSHLESKYFSKLESKKYREIESFYNTAISRQSIVAHKEKSKQAVIKVGQNGIFPTNKDTPLLMIVLSLFGGSILGRLSMLLREKKGYTYGAFSSLSAKPAASEIIAFTSVGNEYFEDTIISIFSEWERLKIEPIEKEELLRTKQYLLGSYSRLMETPQKLLSLFVKTVQQSLPLDFPMELISSFGSITLDEINEKKSQFLHPDQLTLGICGDSSVILDALKKHTEVEIYKTPF